MTDETGLAAALREVFGRQSYQRVKGVSLSGYETDPVDALAAAALAWVDARLADPATVEAVARALEEHEWEFGYARCMCGVGLTAMDGDHRAHVTAAALAVVRGLLGVAE